MGSVTLSGNKVKFTKKDISTMAVVAVALALVVLVFIKVFGGNTLESQANDTTVVVYSSVNDDGEVVMLTMIEYYTDSGLHASVRYPTLPTKATETETETEGFETKVVYVTDADGAQVTDADGNTVTEIETVTTTKPVTEFVTDESGAKVTGANGKAVTQIVTTTEATTVDVWSEVTTSKKVGITASYTNDTAKANTIINEVNRMRVEGEGEESVDALSVSKGLTNSAKSNSIAMALPTGGSRSSKILYSGSTSEGGAAIFNDLVSKTDILTNPDYKNIGVAVVKYKDRYYTTVIVQ